MSVLQEPREKLAGLVEGTFGRVFRSEVRPVELARKLAREMDEHRTVSVSRTYVPTSTSSGSRRRTASASRASSTRSSTSSSAYLLEHARRERLALISRPQIEFRTDERLSLGEFGIQARHGARRTSRQDDAEQGDHGQTMVYSTADARPGGAPRGADRPRRPRDARRRGQAHADRPGGRRHRAQPRVRHRPRRTPTSRAATRRSGPRAATAGRSPTSARRTACKVNGRAIGSAHAAPAGRRASCVGTVDVALRGRAMTPHGCSSRSRSALQFGFLAVLYLFLLWVSRSALRDLRRSGGPRRRLPARSSRPARTRPSLYAATSQAPTATASRGWSSSARPATRPGWSTTSARARCMGRGDQAEIRLEDPFASSRHARLLRQGGIVVLEDLGSTNGTYLNEELARPGRSRCIAAIACGSATASSPTWTSRCCASPTTSSARTPGRRAGANEDSFFARSPMFAVADGMGGAQAGEVASQIAVEVLQQGLPERGGSVEERLRGLRARRRTRASTRCRADRRPARGHGHDADRRLRRGATSCPSPTSATAALYRLRDGDVRAADRRPHAGRGARAPGQADAGGGRGPPAALDHHARARAGGRRRGRHAHVAGARRRRLPASAATVSRR